MSQTFALALSVGLEAPLVTLMAWLTADRATSGGDGPLARRVARWLLVAALATCLTHPIVWHGVTATRPLVASWEVRAAGFEIFAVGVEGLVYRWQMGGTMLRALGLSAVANAVSFGIGLWCSSS